MINILDSGNSSVSQFEALCSNCDCHFGFSKVDTYPHTSQDRDGQSTDYYVDCPKCKHSIAAEGAMNPNRSNGIFGSVSKSIVSNRVLNKINVQQLRATTNDSDFKKLLIKQLS